MKRAFTLIEMLVVIAIMAILAAILLPVLSQATERGRSTSCRNNLHQIGMALETYIDENNNYLPVMWDQATNGPPTNSVNKVLMNQLSTTNVLRCPSDNQKIFELTGSSYSWNFLLNGANASTPHLELLGTTYSLDQIPVFFDKQSFHGPPGSPHAINYLYADEHVKNFIELP